MEPRARIPLILISPCELGGVGRQENQAKVYGYDEITGRMPACLVHQHIAVRP
jgi:hypothetical protein